MTDKSEQVDPNIGKEDKSEQFNSDNESISSKVQKRNSIKQDTNFNEFIDVINHDLTEIENNNSNINLDKFRKFNEVQSNVKEMLNEDLVLKTSTSLDIVASYLKCQKILYLESSYFSTKCLNFLIIPTLIITGGCSVLASYVDEFVFGKLLLASLNAFITVILSIVNFLFKFFCVKCLYKIFGTHCISPKSSNPLKLGLGQLT